MKNIYVLTYEYKQNFINFIPNIRNFREKKTVVQHMKNLLTFNRETYKISKHYSKIHEKVNKFPYIYSRIIQMFNKIHEKIHVFHKIRRHTNV